MFMKRVTLVKLLVNDQDQALEFYTKKLGFEVAEDSRLATTDGSLVRLPDNDEFCIDLDVATTRTRRRSSAVRPPTHRYSASKPTTA
jgi:catechol 2,3-dioxygenase-like lactoylglutathione lyase family enzyme